VWLARVRSFIARHRAIYWTAVAAMAVTVALVLVAQSRQVATARDRWGTSVGVWVVVADTPPGTPIAVDRQLVPEAVVPAHALVGEWPADAVAHHHLSAGEIVVGTDVGTGRLPLLAPTWRAVAIAADETTVAVMIGDRVDIVAGGAIVAQAGLVVDVQPAAAIVGVPAADAAALAMASLDHTAVLVLRPG
jgi:hypothetical protein